MPENQHESLLAQIRELEQTNRRWRFATGGLAVALLVLLILGGIAGLVVTVGYFTARTQAVRAAEEARIEVMRARDEAEAQRQQAEKQRQEAEKRLRGAKSAKDKKP